MTAACLGRQREDRQRRDPSADARLCAAHRRILRPAPSRGPAGFITFVDENGVRRSMTWFRHRNKEESGAQAQAITNSS